VRVSSEREGVAANARWRKAMIHKMVMLMVIHNADGEKENKHETVRCRPREKSENCDDDDESM